MNNTLIVKMADEHVIRRKLLFDGESAGDDRRINLVQKLIVKWILSEFNSQEENKTMYNKILLQLCLIEFSRQKSELVKLRNDKELQLYKTYQDVMKNHMASIGNAITTSKVILAKVKCEKHNKLNYDMIVKDIVVQPSRIESAKFIQQLQLDIENMKQYQLKFKNEFTIMRKHFVGLLTNANQMCLHLDELNCTQNI